MQVPHFPVETPSFDSLRPDEINSSSEIPEEGETKQPLYGLLKARLQPDPSKPHQGLDRWVFDLRELLAFGSSKTERPGHSDL